MVKRSGIFIVLIGYFLLIGPLNSFAADQRIYDNANLLTADQKIILETEASLYFDKWQTDFIIITTNDADGKDIKVFTQDAIDELAEQFNRKEENMALLAIDMNSREFYLAGVGLGEEYLDDDRLDQINSRITPYLKEGDYYGAFMLFFEKSDEYLGIRPGVNPESIFFKTYFQLPVALGLAGAIVFMMAYNSGGRVTVTNQTYLDQNKSKVLSKHDRYLRKTVTKRKKPSNDNRGGGFGGGGGTTGGGRSHSGSRGSF